MLKFRKVYICDCCGRIEKAIATKYKFGIPYKYKEPFCWETILGKTLCPDCVHTYRVINDMCHMNKVVETKFGLFIPKQGYEYSYDDIRDTYTIRRND